MLIKSFMILWKLSNKKFAKRCLSNDQTQECTVQARWLRRVGGGARETVIIEMYSSPTIVALRIFFCKYISMDTTLIHNLNPNVSAFRFKFLWLTKRQGLKFFKFLLKRHYEMTTRFKVKKRYIAESTALLQDQLAI